MLCIFLNTVKPFTLCVVYMFTKQNLKEVTHRSIPALKHPFVVFATETEFTVHTDVKPC